MSAKTPPAWAMKAGQLAVRQYINNKQSWSPFTAGQDIMQYAPDAEALAVALEEILTAHDSDAASGGEMWYAEVLSPIVRKQRTALDAYRAAHPKPA